MSQSPRVLVLFFSANVLFFFNFMYLKKKPESYFNILQVILSFCSQCLNNVLDMCYSGSQMHITSNNHGARCSSKPCWWRWRHNTNSLFASPSVRWSLLFSNLLKLLQIKTLAGSNVAKDESAVFYFCHQKCTVSHAVWQVLEVESEYV